jgi:hypothetical protein
MPPRGLRRGALALLRRPRHDQAHNAGQQQQAARLHASRDSRSADILSCTGPRWSSPLDFQRETCGVRLARPDAIGPGGAVSGLSAHFTAGSSQLIHWKSVRPEMVITATVRFPHFGQRVVRSIATSDFTSDQKTGTLVPPACYTEFCRSARLVGITASIEAPRPAARLLPFHFFTPSRCSRREPGRQVMNFRMWRDRFST